MNSRIAALICKARGHDWAFPGAIRYEQARAMAYVGDNPEQEEVDVTWVCDEVCAVCGAETWWPT